jgi:hypothetical protein
MGQSWTPMVGHFSKPINTAHFKARDHDFSPEIHAQEKKRLIE